MNRLDHRKLVKLINLSASPNDAEALSAARRANDALKAAGLSWSDVISPPSTTPRRRLSWILALLAPVALGSIAGGLWLTTATSVALP